MVLLGVRAFRLPHMPGNHPFLMLKTDTWLVALTSLLAPKHSFAEAGAR